jgi:hypothetical protein
VYAFPNKLYCHFHYLKRKKEGKEGRKEGGRREEGGRKEGRREE